MTSTIQLNEHVKNALHQLKDKKNDSYEDVIVKLLKEKEQKKKDFEELLKEGYQEMNEESLKIVKEFEPLVREVAER